MLVNIRQALTSKVGRILHESSWVELMHAKTFVSEVSKTLEVSVTPKGYHPMHKCMFLYCENTDTLFILSFIITDTNVGIL